MQQTHLFLKNNIVLWLLLLAACLVMVPVLAPKEAMAQTTCATFTSTVAPHGIATQSLPNVGTRLYRVWARVKAPDGAAQFRLSIDGSAAFCDKTLSGTGSANQWFWVSTPAAGPHLDWKGGTARIQMGGTKAGVGLDCVVLSSDLVTPLSTIGDCDTKVIDTSPPTVPSNFVAGTTTTNGIPLSWTAPTDDVGVARYELSRKTGTGSFAVINSSITATTFSDTGLAAGTSYTYSLVALDAKGNRSPAATVTATTQALTATITLPKVLTPPVIDGSDVQESVWTKVTANTINRTIVGTVSSSLDLSGTYKAMWDASNLYFYVNVVDDQRSVNTSLPSGERWKTDSVEIYVDGDASGGTSYTGDANVRSYIITRGENITYAGGVAYPATISQKEITGGYVVELRIPWTTIGTAAGSRVGLDIHINDDDNNDNIRDGKVAWYTTIDDSWRNPSLFALVNLGTNTVSGTTNTCSKYDTNGDGSLTFIDALFTYGQINKTDTTLITRHDINGDGIISFLDALAVYGEFRTPRCTT